MARREGEKQAAERRKDVDATSPPPAVPTASLELTRGRRPNHALLPTTGTSIQSALSAAGLGSLDMTARGVLALPLYAFSDVQIERVWEKLPLI